MTFVAGFYSFNIEIVNPEVGTYEPVRLKTPLHPREPIEHLHARVLAYCHSYRSNLEFTEGLFSPKDPTIWCKNILGEYELWLQLGCPDPKKLKRALRLDEVCELRVYFWEGEQIDHFCRLMRGSKTNWVNRIQFFRMDPEFLVSLEPHLASSNRWSVTLLDGALYLEIGGTTHESEIGSLDMWEHYQTSIQEDELSREELL